MIKPVQFDTNSSPVSSTQIKSLHLFWLGFALYTLCYTISPTTLGTNQIFAVLQFLGLLLMIFATVGLIKFKIANPYLKFIYILYCIWLIGVILRGLNHLSDYSYIRNFLLFPRDGILYFAPLVLLLPLNAGSLNKVFDTILFLGIFYIIYDIIFIRDLLNSDTSSSTSQGIVEIFSDLSFSSGFILLTLAYHSKKRQLLAIATVVLALLFSVIRARRGLTFMYTNMILLSYILFVSRSKMKFLIIYLTILIALIGALYISGIYKPHENRLFGSLIERGNEDSRSLVEIYFYDDMKTKDWIIGKGIYGEYFAPNVLEDQITNYRGVIETGYEQTILKGGIISLGLFLLIAIPAMLRGLFFSKNVLSKAAGIWIFMSLINSYPATVNAFTLQYLLVWVSIGICYSKEIGNISESTMINMLKRSGKIPVN